MKSENTKLDEILGEVSFQLDPYLRETLHEWFGEEQDPLAYFLEHKNEREAKLLFRVIDGEKLREKGYYEGIISGLVLGLRYYSRICYDIPLTQISYCLNQLKRLKSGKK